MARLAVAVVIVAGCAAPAARIETGTPSTAAITTTVERQKAWVRCPCYAPPTTTTPPDRYTTAAWPPVGMTPRNSTEACISRRENAGSYGRSSNPSHFGRWQISRTLWTEHGGGPDWGWAGPAEQDRVFRAIVNADSYAPWTPFDGCAA